MEEPGRLQSMGLQRVGHDWATSLSLFSFMHWRRKWQPTLVFLPAKSQGWRSLVAAVHEVSKSRLSNFTLTFHFHALEKEMATHSSILAWRIPGMREPGGLPSMGSHRVGHNWSDLAVAAICLYLPKCPQPKPSTPAYLQAMTYSKPKSLGVRNCFLNWLCNS